MSHHHENAAISSATKPEHDDSQALGNSESRPLSSVVKVPMPAAVQVDHRQITMEGFRTLSILATFFAGLQAQMLSASLSDNSTMAAKMINAFWLAGIFLDVFGAVLATVTTRWLELLNSQETETLNQEWSAPRKEFSIRKFRWSSLLDTMIATALFSGFPLVACGVSMFLIGLVIYVWAMQPLLVSIISTIPFVVLSPLVAACFYPHFGRKHDILEVLARKRGAW
jgi:hypothetical protein